MAEHFLRNLFGSFRFVSFFAQLDEPRIFGKAARIEIERDAVALAYRSHLANVLHRNRLASTGVVGDGEHDERNAVAAHALDQSFESGHIHVAFEGIGRRGLATFGNDQIDGFGANELHVGASRVEVRVVGDDVALPAGYAKQDALGGATLVRGDNVFVAKDVLDGIFEAVEAAAAGVAFVAFHDGRPLVGGHGAGAGVGEQVDQDIVGG